MLRVRPLGPVTSALRTARTLPPAVRLILASMVLFNIGFYLVVPFLAVHLADDLHLAGWAIGLVLGLRTFSQQGMFFLGGSLADRFGVRPMVLLGIAIRVVGFVVLGVASSLATMIVGVVLVGLAAALFSPAVEAANAAYGRGLEESGGIRRTELFGIEQMCSRFGTVIGPALGALLLGVPFAWTTIAAAVLFAGLGVMFALWLPADASTSHRPTGAQGPDGLRVVWRTVLHNRRFMVFVALCGFQLVAYNQLYLMLPEQLERVTGSQAALGWFFVASAVLVIVGQSPTVALAHRLGHHTAIVAGMGVIAASFLFPIVTGALASDSVAAGLVGVGLWVAALHLGQMLMVPPMRDTIGVLAGERHLGAHFGMLSTLGGLMTLVGSLAIGQIYDLVDAGTVAPSTPWWTLAVVVAAAAAGIWAAAARAAVRPRPASG